MSMAMVLETSHATATTIKGTSTLLKLTLATLVQDKLQNHNHVIWIANANAPLLKLEDQVDQYGGIVLKL